jgi:hypothetical protein
MPEKFPGEYTRALEGLTTAGRDPAPLAADLETQFAMLGLAEDLMQRVHWALCHVKHAQVDDTQPVPIQALRAKVQARNLDEDLDAIIRQLRMFVITLDPAD